MYKFHKEKDHHAASFTNQNKQATSFMHKSVSRGEKSTYDFHEEKNQHAASFTNKNQRATSSMIKNQPLTSSRNKIIFSMRKINVQVLRREKSTRNKFCKEKNQHATSFANKNQHTTFPRTKISTHQVP